MTSPVLGKAPDTGPRNSSRYFVERRHVAWVLLIATIAWGAYGYARMPQRKDPDIPVRVAVATCSWPGVKAEKVEELVTRRLEAKIAENEKIERIESVSRTGLSIITVKLAGNETRTSETFDDINLKLNGIRDLPEGAGPINFIKDFGDTCALMLTVASPQASDVEIELRAKEAEAVIRELRRPTGPHHAQGRFSIVLAFSYEAPEAHLSRNMRWVAGFLAEKGVARDARLYGGPGLAVLDAEGTAKDQEIREAIDEFVRDKLRASEINPDIWDPVIVRDPSETRAKLSCAAGSKYTYRELEAFTDEIARALQNVPTVSKVTRWGVQRETVYLEYSQERLAAHGLNPWAVKNVLNARNITLPGGTMDFGSRSLIIEPSGEFTRESELGEVMIASTRSGASAYLRDLVEIERGYESPPQNLNFLAIKDAGGQWRRMRAITLGVNMRAGEQITRFAVEVSDALAKLKARLPEDLVMRKTSDQPAQVSESVSLFMRSLYEAVFLVVVIAFIGFWEWRSAALLALSIPVTLAMTFGMMYALGIDLQQVSIGSLIIALGLLVDDPVVANDAIRNELDSGEPRERAAWLGPTKLARAILYATVTNIVAYLPYLLLKGDTGRFLYSLPVTLTCALVSSRIVSMTFIPFLGYYLLRPTVKGRNLKERPFFAGYLRVGGYLIDHRRKVFAASLVIVAAGVWCKSRLSPQFFPKDLSYLSYVDVWLPEDAPIGATCEAAQRVQDEIVKAAGDFAAQKAGPRGDASDTLASLTAFVGGGGPRFWYSVEPELSQPNYAQILIEVTDNRLTNEMVEPLQQRLMSNLPGMRADVRRLESGPPVGFPVQARISGEHADTLRELARSLKRMFRELPVAYRVHDNWGAPIFRAALRVNADKANVSGVTNLDVARSSIAAMNGFHITDLREGRLTIPVVGRLRMEERAGFGDIQNLYVYASEGERTVPLGQISHIEYDLETEKIVRRNHFRTINVSCFPTPGVLPSEVVAAIMPKLREFEKTLPPGYSLRIGGEHEEQVKGFDEMFIIMLISVGSIYLALVLQFRNAVKPLVVFCALPYGVAGAFASLWIMGAPFGFMAYLGVVSLIGVIVSHIIVLFDFIEERLEAGEDIRAAALDAGVMRLRPVLITVAATVIALVPLAIHGGPLWEPLCYAQIGGLTIATFVTLLMVPVIYAIAALDLKAVK
jgi:multidrug efflux pump subunit AcrB